MEHVGDLGPKASREPKGFSIRRLMKTKPKAMLAISPLFAMVATAFTLAGITVVRQLVISPDVIVNKNKRDPEEEINDPDHYREKGKEYAESSPFYRLAKGSKPGMVISGVQQLPPVLPGDETSATGEQGSAVNKGRRGGGI